MAKPVSKRKKNRTQNQKKSNLAVILIIAAFAIVMVVIIIVSQQGQKPTAPSTAQVVIPTIVPKPQESGVNLGDPNAPVTVIEFADYQCVVCYQYWATAESTFLQTYVATGKVYYTFSPFIIFGQESIDAAEAAYCANDQGKFWAFHDTLFSNYLGENSGSFTEQRLTEMAQGLGLDMTAFTSCTTSKKYDQKITADNAFGVSSGVTGTPSFLVNGKLVYANELNATVEAALAALGK